MPKVTPQVPPALLTIPETAARLRITRRAVYSLINAGLLDTVNISAKGTRSRVPEDSLAAFIESRRAAGRPSEDVA